MRPPFVIAWRALKLARDIRYYRLIIRGAAVKESWQS
jgi:hypothetical protein